MARKDLSRTVIEGGRSNTSSRRASNGVARARTRAWLAHVLVDDEIADARAPRPRTKEYRHFQDKLAPARRWLDAQVGRPWDKVYGELRARFDTRTIAGRHVVFDHLLTWVWRGDVSDRVWSFSQYQFIVDAHGILRRGRHAGRSYRKLMRDLDAWASGRKLARTYRGWWWFRATPVGPPCQDYARCRQRTHVALGGVRYHDQRWLGDRAATAGDLRRLDRLPPELRRSLVIDSPWPSR